MNKSPNPEFDALTNGLEESIRDPAVTELIERVREVETSLNTRYISLSPEDKENFLSALNAELGQKGMFATEIFVSGKLRIDAEEYCDRSDDDEENWNETYGDSNEDSIGAYFYVTHMALDCVRFDIESFTDENGTYRHRVLLYMLSTVEEDNPLSLYVYLDELEDFRPRELSIEYIIREIREHYPEIAAQIDVLPEDCGDDSVILESLADFCLDIDWSQHPGRTAEEQHELLSFVERYIADRIRFDTSQFEFELQGPYYKYATQERLVRYEAFDIIRKRGVIDSILLKEQSLPLDTGPIKTYFPEISFIASSSQRGGGNELLVVPLFTIESAHNLRNAYEPSENPGQEYAPTEENYSPVNITSPTTQELDDGEATSVEIETEFGENANEPREKMLSDINEKLTLLVDAAVKYSNMNNLSDEALGEAVNELSELYLDFYNIYQPALTSIEVSGPGVISVAGDITKTYDEDTGVVTLKIEGTDPTPADILTFKKGVVQSFNSRVKIDEEGNKSLVSYLSCQDINSPEPVSMDDGEEYNFKYMEAHFVKHFITLLDGNSDVTIPEYEKIKNAYIQIDHLKKRYPELAELPVALTKLHTYMQQADTFDYKDFPDTEIFPTIGNMVRGKNDLVEDASTAIYDILSESRVQVFGLAYDESGEMVNQNQFHGQVVDVVSEYKTIPENEPMLKIASMFNGIIYVPISKINHLKI